MKTAEDAEDAGGRNRKAKYSHLSNESVILSNLSVLRGFHFFSLLHRFHEHRRPVGQHFGDALHHFSRVVAGADHRIAA